MVTLSRGEKLTDGIGSTISKDEFLYRLGAQSNGVERDQEETIKRLTAEVQRLRNHYGSHDSATSRVDGGTQSSHSTSVAEPSSLENGSTDPDTVASGIRPEALAQKPAQKPARTRRRVNTAAMIRAKHRAADAWYRELPVRVGYDSVMDKTFRALVLAAKNIRGTPGIRPRCAFVHLVLPCPLF
ncbi:hypothetical protein LTR48_007856, partial [Friedmanniomyces endolithicus]